MSEENDLRYRDLTFHPSRIPALDALSAFVSDDVLDSIFQETAARIGSSRWYPVQGGHRVLILYEGGPYDPDRFTVEKGAWDHEHCNHCGNQIAPMTLCWVTTDGLHIILCASCHNKVLGQNSD